MKRFSNIALLTLAAAFVISSCEDPVINKPETARKYTVKDYVAGYCIDTLYFWNEEVREANKSVNPDSYKVEDYFYKLLYSEDHWSWMEDGESFIESETGIIGRTWGALFSQAQTECFEDSLDIRRYQVRIGLIYPGAPFEAFGVTRGAVLLGIGDSPDNLVNFTSEALATYQKEIVKSPQTFTFRLADGTDTTFTASMAERFATSPVLVTHVFDDSEFAGLPEPVGYINYLNFKSGDFLRELEDALTDILNHNVKKLIVDLRYNTGGDSEASQLMMDIISPASAAGKVYLQRKHNKLLKYFNESQHIGKRANSGLEDIYFITGGNTASASELVINGLKPYMKGHIHLVGGQTYGKPNGMYVCIYPPEAEYYEDIDYVFYPICFFNYNSEDELIPFEGFTPDNERPDDIMHDWGAEEDLIRACLAHITSGEYPPLTPVPAEPAVKSSGNRPGALMKDEMPARMPGYYIKLNQVIPN